MKKKRFVALLKSTMRVTIAQAILSIMFTCAVLASDVEAQILDKDVSVSFDNTEVKHILRHLQKQAQVKFVYSPTAIQINRRISIHLSHKKLGEVLDEMLPPLGIHYEVKDDHIVLFKKADKNANGSNGQTSIPETDDVMQRTVTGKVTDENNEGLPGVSVIIKGTNIGSTTDAAGDFSLVVPTEHENGIMVFSFVGYQSREIGLQARTNINVQLQPDINALQEVVVVGFGEQRKISLVGAHSTVDVTQLKQPVANMGTMLAGRLAGIVQVQRNGNPGQDNADIWIRGLSTWPGQGARPLVLVDGVERSLDNIDPQDIESFSIMKDASATAVYGVRGANGVILIKTRSGRAGKTELDFNYNQGVTSFTRIPEMADGPTYMKLANEALTTRGNAPKFSQEQIDRTASGEDPFVYPDVNWMKEVFNPSAANRRVNVNATGGGDKAVYYVSLAYYNEEGFLKTDGIEQYNATTKFTRYNFTSNLTLDITPTTKLDLGVQGYVSNANYPGIDAGDAFQQAMWVTPIDFPVMYPGGLVPGRNPNGDQRNPYADVTQRGYRNQFRNQTYSNARLTQKLDFLVKGLSFTSMFSFDAWNSHDINRIKRKDTWFVDVNNPRNADGTLNLFRTYSSPQVTLGYSRGVGGNRRFYTESSLNYNTTIGKHYVTGMMLFNQNDYTNSSPFPDNFTNSIPFRNRGIAGRATYSYSDKYFAEFNFGYTGSENFAPNKRYGFFPAYGVGWIASDEAFFAPARDVIQFLKFRFSDGLVGSGTISANPSNLRRFGYLTFVSEGRPGYLYGKPGNLLARSGIEITDYGTDVTWSTSRKTNLGIEIRTLRETVSLNVDLWKEHRTGIFLQRGSVPDIVGLSSVPWANLGTVDNKGIDVNLEVYEIKPGPNVQLTMRGNFNYNRDEIIENDQPPQAHPWLDARGSNVLAYWGYIAEGLFESDAEVASHAVQPFGDVRAGDIKYRDMNEDGTIDAKDIVQIGIGDVPRVTFGAGFNFTWKNLGFGAFFQGVRQADRMISGLGIWPFIGDGGTGNVYSIATDRWTEENPDPGAFYPRLSYGSGNINNYQSSSWWVKDISFTRLKTAEISYSVPSHLIQKLRMSQARIYAMGVNLLTFSKFKLWDPELNTSNGTRYPLVKTVSVGVNVTF